MFIVQDTTPTTSNQRLTARSARRTRADINAAIPAFLPPLLEGLLAPRIGGKLAMKMPAILGHLKSRGYRCDARSVRAAIRELRRQGMLLCSDHRGYFVASSLLDIEAFCGSELEARAFDLIETAKILRAEARKQFGEGVQVELFSFESIAA